MQDPKVLSTAASLTKRALEEFQASLFEVPEDYEITDADDLAAAGTVLRQVKSRFTELEDLRKTMTRPLDQAKRAVLELFAPVEFNLKQAESRLKNAVSSFLRGQEAERRRLEAELRDKQEAERKAAEEKAAKLRAKGKDEQADDVISRVDATPIVVADVPKVPGVSVRGIWKAEVTDLLALILWSAARENDSYLTADMPTLNAYARATKGAAPIGGVRFYEEASVAVRS